MHNDQLAVGAYHRNILMNFLHNSGIIFSGSVLSSQSALFIEWGHKTHKKTEFEILVGGSTACWIKSSNGNVPENAIDGGHTANRAATLYIGRKNYNGNVLVGKVEPPLKGCFIPKIGTTDGLEFTDYEVLVIWRNNLQPKEGSDEDNFIFRLIKICIYIASKIKATVKCKSFLYIRAFWSCTLCFVFEMKLNFALSLFFTLIRLCSRFFSPIKFCKKGLKSTTALLEGFQWKHPFTSRYLQLRYSQKSFYTSKDPSRFSNLFSASRKLCDSPGKFVYNKTEKIDRSVCENYSEYLFVFRNRLV